MSDRKIILVDQDNVLADFNRHFERQWRMRHPGLPYVRTEDLNTYSIEEHYPAEHRQLVREIYLEPGFFRSLPPIEGGIDSLLEMRKHGHEVFICSAPLKIYGNCVLEKYEWIDRVLGSDWTKRVILTRDKTIVLGDYLIDDNPRIEGACVPSWEHVIYDQPYNRDMPGKRIVDWRRWKDVLGS